MAPLMVGDFVTVTGTYIGSLLEINALNVNLQFLTAPGTKPAYLWCEEAIYGIVTTQGGEVGETRAVAWTSDPTTPIQWFSLDVDPCTGDITERNLNLQQPTTGAAPLGRVVYRLGKTDASPAPRQVGFRATTGVTNTLNNITAGQYIQPIFSYTFPELIAFGTPMFPNSFEVTPYLAQGSGPYVPGTFGASPPISEVIVDQLSPWPGALAPGTTSCAPKSSPTISSPPTTLSTTTSSPATTSSAVPKDVITIISASQASTRGIITVTASASSNNPDAQLFMTVAGPNPITATVMTKSGSTYSLSISVKNKGTSVTITSNFGGSATVAIK